ncbi:MAG: response regulator [Anaerovoracaceae bacterium]|jgi:DNA-binding NarL/FixJ family response regulator
MTKVFIVDDHASMRESLISAFEKAGDFEVVGDIASAKPALLFCRRLKSDLALLDICTEGNASGLTAAAEIKEELPNVKIVIMTAFGEVSYIPRAKELGADAFIYKSESLCMFIKICRMVMAGKKVFPEPKEIPALDNGSPLTKREMEILRLICRSLTSQEIADQLYISVDTVKYHKRNMLQKTGFKRTIDLAFYLVTNGWINPLY